MSDEDTALAAELDALESHRMRYAALVPGASLERDDPDVRRLIEALALFTVRTRRVARRNVSDSVSRLFRQYHAYLLEPAPATSRVVANVGPNFADPVDIPRGTELLFTPLAVAPGEPVAPPLSMTTVESLRVLPLTLDNIRVTDSGRKLSIELASRHGRKDLSPDGNDFDLQFEVNHLNEFASSAAVLSALQNSVSAVAVVYEPTVSGVQKRERVSMHDLATAIRFGAREPSRSELHGLDQPLQRLQMFFQNPWSELRFSVRVPRPARVNLWSRIRVELTLDQPWPRHLVLQPESLRLNSVPVVNLKRDWASPIVCDGTRTRYPILHSLPTSQLKAHSVLGVYSFTPQGPVPMHPSTVAQGTDQYEIEIRNEDGERRLFLNVDRPDAFSKAMTLGIEALWHQSRPAQLDGNTYNVRLAGGFVSNVVWSATSMTPEAEAVNESDPETLLRILALKQQRVLSRDEFVFLLKQLGALRQRELRTVLGALREVRRTEVPYGKSAGGLKSLYTLVLRGLDASMTPVLSVLAPQLRAFLSVWSQGEAEVTVSLPERENADLSEVDVREAHVAAAARTRGNQ